MKTRLQLLGELRQNKVDALFLQEMGLHELGLPEEEIKNELDALGFSETDYEVSPPLLT